MNITNNSNIPLALAVWLVHDEYDYVKANNYVSATKLMKPIRHLVLPGRVPSAEQEMDLADYVSRAMGHSLHDSIEKAWINGKDTNLKKLGYPKAVTDRVLVNPAVADLKANSIPVYLEQRAFKKVTVDGIEFTIGGKFDMVAEGIVHDNKSTTAMTWLFGTKDDDYKLQGSIYRWLNTNGFADAECTQPLGVDRITENFIRINFIFTDWSKMMAKQNPNYPQSRCKFKDVPLMSVQETDDWVKAKLASFLKYAEADEKDIPHCTDEELWISDPVYKYYADPAKTSGRSTKNFENATDAKSFLASKGGKGVLITKPGEPKRCGYCEAFPICSQKDKYFDA